MQQSELVLLFGRIRQSDKETCFNFALTWYAC